MYCMVWPKMIQEIVQNRSPWTQPMSVGELDLLVWLAEEDELDSSDAAAADKLERSDVASD